MLSYNGILLAYTNTIAVDQGPERDPSGTDATLFATRIRVKAVVAPGIDPATGGETPPVTAERIAHMLCTPRRPLLFAPDGVNYLVNLPGGLDDANGPWPDDSAFSIQEITPGSYSVTFAVTVRETICDGASSRPYLSLRWTEATDVDSNWLLVKRRSGLLICSSRGPAAPDDLRHLCTPGIYAGFRRESADYQLDESGLRLKFNFVDRQLASAVPYPLTDFEGQMTEIVTNGGVTRKADFRLKATAPPGVPKRAMLNTVLMMAMSRVYSTNAVRSKAGAIMLNGAIGERLSTKENVIEVGLNWNLMPVQARERPSASGGGGGTGLLGSAVLNGLVPGLGTALGVGSSLSGGGTSGSLLAAGLPSTAAVAAFASWMGQPFPGEDPGRGIAPPTRGLVPWVTLAAAVLNDPCGMDAVLTAGGSASMLVGTSGSGASVTASIVSSVTPDDEASLYAGSASGGVWQTYHLTCTYLDDTGLRILHAVYPEADGMPVRVHSATRGLRVEYHLVRMGGFPTEPEIAETRDPNWVYLRGSTSLSAVTVAADGVTPIFEAAGVWEFEAINAKKAQLRYPVPPFLQRALVALSVTENGSGTGSATGGGSTSLPPTGGVTPSPGSIATSSGGDGGSFLGGLAGAVEAAVGPITPPVNIAAILIGVEGQVATALGANNSLGTHSVGP